MMSFKKKLRGTEAAQILNLSAVHISRLKQRLLKNSLEGLLRKPPCFPPSNKTHKKEKQIKDLLNNREFAFDVKKAPTALYLTFRRKTKYVPPLDHPWRRFKFGKRSKEVDVRVKT